MNKKTIFVAVFALFCGGLAQAQTAYTYIKQGKEVVVADGVAGYDVSTKKAVLQFDGEGNAIMTIDGATVAKLPMTDNAVLTTAFTNESGIETTGTKSVTVTSAGYATYYSPFALQVPSGSECEVYAPTYADGKLYLNDDTRIEANSVIPAGTGLLLKNAGDITFDLVATAPTVTETGDLSGTSVAMPVTAGTILTLGHDSDNNLGFLTYGKSTLAAGKAYLDRSLLSNEVKAVVFCTDDEETGIASLDVDSTPSDRTVYYNLNGQRVNATAKGIVIANGKKYINK